MQHIRIALLLLSVLLVGNAEAKKKYPVIKFEQTTIDIGTFSMGEPVQKCVFKFRNVGTAKLVINYVHTACGCTVADYPKDYISPGGSGEITVTYDATGNMPGRFKKHIQVFTNCKNDLARIFVQGQVTALPRETRHSR